MRLFISLSAPHTWIILAPKNQIKDSGTVASLDNYRVPKIVEQVIGVAPGDAIACHTALIPGKRRKVVESALPYALEERLTEDVDQIHFKLLDWRSNEPIKAVVTAKVRVESWIKHFRQYGINLDAIIAEYFLLPKHAKSDITISPGVDGQFHIRMERYRGMLVDMDGFSYWWDSIKNSKLSVSITDLDYAKRLIKLADQEVEPGVESINSGSSNMISHWDIGGEFTQWLTNSDDHEGFDEFNILDGEFQPLHNRKSANLLKIAGVVGILAIVVHLGIMTFAVNEFTKKRDKINSEMRSLFSNYFPGEPYLDRPRSQITTLIAQAKSGTNTSTEFQVLLNAVSQITPKFNAIVDEVSYRDSEMIVLCTVRDLASLDNIRQGFIDLGSINAVLLSSGARDGKVTGRFQLSKGG